MELCRATVTHIRRIEESACRAAVEIVVIRLVQRRQCIALIQMIIVCPLTTSGILSKHAPAK